jgi:transcriptional regulator with XRE-family HTH domain
MPCMVQLVKNRLKNGKQSTTTPNPGIHFYPKRKWEKGQRNKWLSDLRKAIRRSQKQFASMIGVSANVIINIENGKSPLTPTLAQKIYVATGVSSWMYWRGDDRILDISSAPYTRSTFDNWMARYADSDDMRLNEFFRYASDTLFILLAGAAKYKLKNQLPALRQSFHDWCVESHKRFDLEAPIKEFLKSRKYIKRLTMSYGDWRTFGKDFQKLYEFKDDHSKPDDEDLTLQYECTPGFGPCFNMKGPESGIEHEHLVFTGSMIKSTTIQYAKSERFKNQRNKL